MKKELLKYNIPIIGLKEKEYLFEYEGAEDFFGCFDQDIINKGKFSAKVVLNKTQSMIKLNFTIDSSLELICDRSLEKFEQEYTINEEYLFKFGDSNELISESIEVIESNTQEINIAQLIFEYIVLAVPVKKLHPKLEGQDTDPWVYVDESQDEKDSETDPRWDALNKLK